MTSSRNPLYFPALTGLRAMAAYLVFFCHNPLPAKRVGDFLFNFTAELYIGVSVFFVLSGFLITIRYQDLFKTTTQRLLPYFQNRFARIYPMYFILTTLTFLFYHSDKDSTFSVYIMNITFLRGFFEKILNTGIGRGWTLTVEECFYLLAPVIFLTNKKWKAVWLLVILYLVGCMLVLLFRGAGGWGFFASFKFMFTRTFFGRCFEFFAGMAGAKLYQTSGKYHLFPRYKTITGGGGIIFCVLLLTWIKAASGVEFGFYTNAGLAVNDLLLPVCVMVFIAGIISEQTPVRKLLESKTAVLLGKSSYTFYLIHVGFIEELIRIHLTHNYLYNFPFLILIAVLLFKFVEEPLTVLLRTPAASTQPILE